MSKPRLLVVEDDEALLVALERLLSPSFAVTTAGTGEEALDVALQRSFDLVLTDYAMPGMDGVSMAEELRSRGHSEPVLVVTGNEHDEQLQRALKTGLVEAVVPKPWTRLALVGHITSSLTRHGWTES